ncbi:MAG TPA: hypothetical protein VFF22_07840 [Pseudomonas sp.]|nr:hypothetical protein [Pseudomonas sp.]
MINQRKPYSANPTSPSQPSAGSQQKPDFKEEQTATRAWPTVHKQFRIVAASRPVPGNASKETSGLAE